MNLKNLIKELRHLNNYDLLIVLAFTTRRWLRHKLSALHPAHIVLPISALQVFFFIITVGMGKASNLIPTLAVGNLLIVALALIPITLPRRHKPIKAHWIRPHE